MLRSLKVLFATSLALLVIWIVISACDGNKPTKPVPFVDYPVYFSSPEPTPKLFIYHPVTRQVDSINIPWEPREGITVSADGKRLYLAQRTSVVVVDTDSLALITELPYEPDRPVAVSPDNQLLAIANGGLHILNAADHSVVLHDSTPVIHCVFSSDSKSVYCAEKGTSSVYKLDLSDSTHTVTRKEFAEGMITHVVPSIDESKWFLYIQFSTFGFIFEVYDVLRDSIIFRETLVPGYGQIAITPDGRYVFFNNPGRSGTDPPSEPGFTIFDVEANKVERVVTDIDFFSGSSEICNWVAHPNSMSVTPDGRWLAMLGGSLALRVLYLYDIRKGQLVHREDWGGCGHVFTNLSIQNAR